jgi:hypothetical protein
MNIKTVAIIAVLASSLVFGLPFINVYFTKWSFKSDLRADLGKMSKPGIPGFTRFVKLAVEEYDLPVDVENEDELYIWFEEETKTLGADFYYVEDVNIYVTVVPVEFEFTVQRTWSK